MILHLTDAQATLLLELLAERALAETVDEVMEIMELEALIRLEAGK